MPSVLWSLDFTPTDPPPLKKFALMLNKVYQQLARVVNGGISFGNGTTIDNINGFWAGVVDTGTANTDFIILHKLGRVPVGYFVMTTSKATNIYNGVAPWTDTTISLRSSAANAAVSLFII